MATYQLQKTDFNGLLMSPILATFIWFRMQTHSHSGRSRDQTPATR